MENELIQIVLGDVAPLKKDIPIPLYYQLKQYITNQIEAGNWPAGHRIPSELQICERFTISRPTVRQAISELVTEGHLTRKYRMVIVARPKVDASFFNTLQSFNSEMIGKNIAPDTRVITLDVRTNREAAQRLGLGEKDKCIYLERLRFADAQPIVWVETYLPYGPFRELMNVDFERVSLYESIERLFSIRISWVDRTFEAVAANANEAEILDVKRNSPLCFVKTVAHDRHDHPVEFSIARYPGDKNKFRVRIER